MGEVTQPGQPEREEKDKREDDEPEGLFDYFTKIGKDDTPTSDAEAPAP
jgi:hypothetical protein